MFIKYFIPEDGDEQSHPNVFKIENVQQPTLADIKRAFPVPGIYHYRFLKSLGSQIVWLDISDDKSQAPFFQGTVFVKASRISTPTSSSGIDRASNGFHSNPPTVKQTSAASSTAPATAVNTTAVPAKPVKPAETERRNSEKLLKFDDDIPSPTTSGKKGITESETGISPLIADSDLLGMTSTSNTNSPVKASSSHGDFFGLEAIQPSTSNTGASNGGSGGIAAPMKNTSSGSNVMGGSSMMSRNNVSGGGGGGTAGMNTGSMRGGTGLSGGSPGGGGGMNPMMGNVGGGGAGGGGMTGMNPMAGGSGSNLYSMGGAGPMGGPMGGGGGNRSMMHPSHQQQQQGRNAAAFDPFNNLAGLQGNSSSSSNRGGRKY